MTTTRNKQRTKKQHYVPRFYLRYFVDQDDNLWVYDKVTGDVRISSPEKAGFEKNFYSLKDDQDQHIDLIDEWLTGVERTAAPLYGKVLGGEVLKGQEKMDFAVFLSSLYTRSPAYIRAAAELYGKLLQNFTAKQFKNRDDLERIMDEVDEKNGTTTSEELRDKVFELYQSEDKSSYELEVDKKKGLRAMKATDHITEVFYRMSWAIFEISSQHLVTSDNPVVRLSPKKGWPPVYGDGGFLNPDVWVTVPLSPRRVLELSWREQPTGGVYPANKQRGRACNRFRAIYAERYVFASERDEGIVKLCKKRGKPGLQLESSEGDASMPVKVTRRIVD